MITSPDDNIIDGNINHLYLALRSIREVDRLLMKMKDRSRLIQAICDTLIKNRSYYNAWIVMLNEKQQVGETAAAGFGDGFDIMREFLNKGVLTDCGRTAMARDEVVVITDPYKACTDCPLSENYSGRSAMTVRLESEGRVFGLLCVSIPRQFANNRKEIELLKEIAGDISYGLNKLETEESLKREQSSFQKFVENSPLGIVIVEDDLIIYKNPEQDNISGIFHQVGRKFEFVNVHEEDLSNIHNAYNKVRTGQVRTVDVDFRLFPDGKMYNRAKMKWIHFRASLINSQGKGTILINMIDITKARELEQLLFTKDKMASLGHIAAGIAHEIRNPLSGINIYLNTLKNVLEKNEEPEMVSKILNQIQSASRKIELIIKRVIDFSRPSNPKLVLADINKPIREALELSSVAMRKSKVSLETELAENLSPCYLDATLIEEVMLNLITNAKEAMKHNEGEKRIAVSTNRLNSHIVVKVSDSGPGIPSEMRTQVLEPFYTTKNSGTGIGLSLCHRIIVDHGGELRISSSKWNGAEFIVKIPVGEKNDA